MSMIRTPRVYYSKKKGAEFGGGGRGAGAAGVGTGGEGGTIIETGMLYNMPTHFCSD